MKEGYGHKEMDHPRHHLAHEVKQHMGRIHHEKEMLEMHSKGVYKHEEDKPSQPPMGHDNPNNMGLGKSFIKECDPIAYGQAGMEGCHRDEKRIHAQMKEYHWE